MNHNFRPGSCPSTVYDLLKLRGPTTLEEIYLFLNKRAQTSIRRSLYTLQDEFIVEKTDDGTKWKTVL